MNLNLPHCERYGCDRLAPPGMVVCSDCMDSLVLRLRDTRDLEHAVLACAGHGLRFAGSGGVRRGKGAENPIPFNERLSTVAGTWRAEVMLAANSLAVEVGLDPVLGVASAAELLADNSRWIQRHPKGAEMVTFLIKLYTDVLRLVDAPVERTLMGICGEVIDLETTCQARLYAVPGRDEVVCPGCGFEHPVYGRRASLKSRARSVALPPSELARAVDGLGFVEVTAQQIQQWHRRKKLVPVRYTPDARALPMFLVGDVIDLVESIARDRTPDTRAAR